MLYFFFLPCSVFFFCIFFFLKKFKPHSLTHFKHCIFFFSGTGKKKIQCFYSLTQFCRKCPKNELFQEKKKNTVPLELALVCVGDLCLILAAFLERDLAIGSGCSKVRAWEGLAFAS